jgi:hypothetical protein
MEINFAKVIKNQEILDCKIISTGTHVRYINSSKTLEGYCGPLETKELQSQSQDIFLVIEVSRDFLKKN